MESKGVLQKVFKKTQLCRKQTKGSRSKRLVYLTVAPVNAAGGIDRGGSSGWWKLDDPGDPWMAVLTD